jgi:hypothetical protein
MTSLIQRLGLMLALLFFSAPPTSGASDIGWPEAVDQLTAERTQAETCAGLFKRYADQSSRPSGELAYGEAKANFDGVIAGLQAALIEKAKPNSLATLQADLAHGAASLQTFCKMAADVIPLSESGGKGIAEGIVKAAIEPVIAALSKAVAALYNESGDRTPTPWSQPRGLVRCYRAGPYVRQADA